MITKEPTSTMACEITTTAYRMIYKIYEIREAAIVIEDGDWLSVCIKYEAHHISLRDSF